MPKQYILVDCIQRSKPFPRNNWGICAFCQVVTDESLQCPLRSTKQPVGSGYASLAEDFLRLQTKNIVTFQTQGDADLLIALKAIDLSVTSPTVVHGEDTDLLVLLLHYSKETSHNIYLSPKAKKNAKSVKLWDIMKTKKALGPNVANHILFVHAFLGCDTTSRINGASRPQFLKRLQQDRDLRESAAFFLQPNVTQVQIASAGLKAVTILYNGSSTKNLNSLRFEQYVAKGGSANRKLEANSLPMTEDAAIQHCYHQIQEWLGRSLDACSWGWYMDGLTLHPVRMTLPAAPNELLQVVRCGCKKGCATTVCSCRKHSVTCNSSCSPCNGVECTNTMQTTNDDNLSDSESLELGDFELTDGNF